MKYLTIILILLLCSISFSQVKLTTYESAIAEKTYDIKISGDDNNNFTLWIYAYSTDSFVDKCGLMIKKKNYQSFITALNEAKLKYIDWVKIAKDNNVTEMAKNMPIKCKVGAYFQYGNDWHHKYIVNLNFPFAIVESGGILWYTLGLRVGEIESSTNEYIDMDGLFIPISSADELEDFMNAISMKKINEFFKKPKIEDLFQ